MAKSFSELVKSRRNKGGSITGSLSYGIKERLKEKFDPRRMINQKGLLTALFPSLRAYQAGGVNKSGSDLNSSEMVSTSLSSLEPILDTININTKIVAKNSMVLPMMHRDINVMRQNMAKLVTLKGGSPATKADMFFMKAKDRQAAYNVQSKEETVIKPTPKKEEENLGFLASLFSGLLKGIKKIGETITSSLSDLAKSIPSLLLSSVSLGMSFLNLIFGLLPPWVKLFLLATSAAAALLLLMGAGSKNNLKQKREFSNNPVGGALLGGDEAVFAQVAGMSDEERESSAKQQKMQQEVLDKEQAPFLTRVYKVGVPEFLSSITDTNGKRKYDDEKIAEITGWPLESVKRAVAKKLNNDKKKLENQVGPKATLGRQQNPELAKKYDDIVAQLNGYGSDILKSDTQKKLENQVKQTASEKKNSKLTEVTSGREKVVQPERKESPKVEPTAKETGKVVDGGSKLLKATMKTPNENNSEVNVNNNNSGTVNKRNSTQSIPSVYDPVMSMKFRGISVPVPTR